MYKHKGNYYYYLINWPLVDPIANFFKEFSSCKHVQTCAALDKKINFRMDSLSATCTLSMFRTIFLILGLFGEEIDLIMPYTIGRRQWVKRIIYVKKIYDQILGTLLLKKKHWFARAHAHRVDGEGPKREKTHLKFI